MKALQRFLANSLFIALAAVCSAQTLPLEKLTPLDEALDLYQQFSGKTVIRSPNLPVLSEFTKPVPSSETNGMKVVLENDLFNKGIQFIPHREVFALAVPVGWSDSPDAQYLATLKPRPTDASLNPKDQPPGKDSIPPGTIDLRGADLNQVLNLYEMLVHRNIVRGSQLNSPAFKLHTQTPLPKSDAIYMLEVALALSGIASVEDGTNFVQIVPLRRVATLKLQAPQRNPDEPLFAPDKIRNIPSGHFAPGKRLEASRQGAVNELVAYYAELTGRAAVPSGQVGGIPIVFRAQTPLTKPELLYALETTLALSGLAIIDVDDKTIRAGFVSEQNQAKK